MPAKILRSNDREVKIEITVLLGDDMLENELAIQEAVNEAGVLATGSSLERFDTDGSVIEVAGRRLHPKKLNGEYKQPKTYQTPYGPVGISRYVYQGSGGGKSYCPLENAARTIGTSTPMLAKQVSGKYSRMGGPETVEDFREHGRELHKSFVQSLAECVADIADLKAESWNYHTPRLEEPVRAVTIGVDGGCASFRDEGWREVMVGTIALYGFGGDRLHTIYVASAPEHGKKQFFERMEFEIAHVKELYPFATYIGLSDGAGDHWTFLEKHTEVQTLDFFHAGEYLGLASKALYPGARQLEEKQQWLEEQCHRLKHKKGAASRIKKALEQGIGEVRTKAQREDLQKAATYFSNQKHRMKYSEMVDKGLPIGSGVTEAGCKVIIKQRLCQAGMRWKEKGCASVLRLRALNRTEGRWEQFWQKISRYGIPTR